ncbi:hypothetical protein SHL15_7821 [Streptomyces hygroscopicus subsp. limoneus]|nr:hypothetical protein SHL15_7821 [Streptomyces hygroscopicus subsp. limoneus]
MNAALTPDQPSAQPQTGRHPEPARPETTRTGHCQCRRIAYQVLGEPIDPHLCACLVREAYEEAGLVIESADVELVHTVHMREQPTQPPRVQLFFRARRWEGEPKRQEPDKCLSWQWWNVKDLPEPIVPYTRAAIEGIQAGRTYTELGWGRRPRPTRWVPRTPPTPAARGAACVTTWWNADFSPSCRPRPLVFWTSAAGTAR